MMPELPFAATIPASFTRLLHFGVAYGDLMEATRHTTTAAAWAKHLAGRAREYARIAETAWGRGHVATAVEGWRRAADYWHFAEFKLGAPSPSKRALQRQSRTAYRRLAPHLDPPALAIEVPLTSGQSMPGYVRSAGVGTPCVILVNGLDSAKEVELDHFSEVFLRRGISTVTFDGPGQGELAGVLPIFEFDRAIPALLDYLQRDAGFGSCPFGILGVSFGGYLACRAAALDARLRACISLGGFFSGAVLERLPGAARANLLHACQLPSDSELSAIAERLSLAPLSGRMDRPVLIVHGARDHLVSRVQIEALRDWAGSRASLWVMADGEHVCTNRFPECLAGMGDWLVESLTREAAWRGGGTPAGPQVEAA